MSFIKNFFKKIFHPKYLPGKWLWVILRIAMGWMFLWGFLDKVFGLGFTTAPDKAWLAGGSPTFGFLNFGSKGPFTDFFHILAGQPIIDWLFMLGLLFVGLALIFGVFMKLASYSGAAMVFLMWLAVLPPEHNPFLDDHLIYLVLLIALGVIKAGQYFGLGKWWTKTKFVKKYPLFE